MYIFIVNPHARSGLGHTVWNELELILKQKNVSYQVHFTKYRKHASDLAKELTSDGSEHILIALGGDGTVNEIVNGITDFQKTVLGYIPIGSSNDFARSLNIPTDPVAALELILSSPPVRPLDIGTLQYENKQKHFSVSTGIGFDAAICHEAVISRLKPLLNRFRLGKLTYAAIALHRLFLTTPQSMTLTLDHEKTVRFQSTYFTAIMNHKYEGGGLNFCPNALPDDGKLDIIVVDGISKLKILLLLPTAFKGWHTHFKGVHIYTCHHASIETEHASPVHTDGEPVFLQRQITASCNPCMLNIIVPK